MAGLEGFHFSFCSFKPPKQANKSAHFSDTPQIWIFVGNPFCKTVCILCGLVRQTKDGERRRGVNSIEWDIDQEFSNGELIGVL